jgi:hypothetical protein
MLFGHPFLDVPFALLFCIPGVLGPLCTYVLMSDEVKRDIGRKPFAFVVRTLVPLGLFFGGTTVLTLVFLNVFRQETRPPWRVLGTFLQGAVPSSIGLLVGWRLLYSLLKRWGKEHAERPDSS